MPRLSLGAPDDGDVVEVDLFGVEFTLKPITRTVQKVLEKVDAAIEAAQNGDEVLNAVADGLGVMLAPANGNRSGAKKLLLDKWKSDELSLNQVTRLFSDLTEASAPPT